MRLKMFCIMLTDVAGIGMRYLLTIFLLVVHSNTIDLVRLGRVLSVS
jgi:hypothetical protein